MPLDSFDSKSMQPDQPSIDSVKEKLNESYVGVWGLNNSSPYSAVVSPERVLLAMEEDRLRAEQLSQSFKEVDHMFTADKITCPNDATELPVKSIEGLVKEKPVEESCAILSHFLSNKIALSGAMSKDTLLSFKESEERAKMVEEVRDVITKTIEWPQWVEDLGENAANAARTVSEISAEGVALVSEGAAVIAEDTSAFAREAMQNLEEGAETVASVSEEVAQATAEIVVDSAEAVCYITQRTAVGGIRFVENCSDYVEATVNSLVGNEEVALDTIQRNVADDLSARIDAYYDPSETLQSIGDTAEFLGEAATGVGLTVAAISTIPSTATIMGSAVAANAVAGTSVALVGLNAAGRTLNEAVSVTGEVGLREISSATVAGVATAGATAVAGVINGQIPSFVAKVVAEHAVADNLTVQAGGRLVGVLSSSAIAGMDVGLFRTAEMASDITDVALGLETDYSVLQEIGESVVSVAGAAVVAGLGYDVLRTIQGSNLFRNAFHTPEYADYFDYIYRSELGNYAREIVIHVPDWWTEEQIAQAQDKINALNEAAQNGELARTPVERSGSASSRYRSEYGADSIPEGHDVDHIIDLQLGGADNVSNMRPIDSSVNRSFGRQINSQISDVPYGTPITRISLA